LPCGQNGKYSPQAVSKIGIKAKFAECDEAQPQEYKVIFRGLHFERDKEIGFYNIFKIACTFLHSYYDMPPDTVISKVFFRTGARRTSR